MPPRVAPVPEEEIRRIGLDLSEAFPSHVRHPVKTLDGRAMELATRDVEEADRYAARCAEALRAMHEASASWPPRPALEHDSTGPIPRVNLSVKISALTPLLRPEAPEVGERDASARLLPLMTLARD